MYALVSPEKIQLPPGSVVRKYDGFTPVTMSLPEESGIEPDYYFYINNWEAVLGKKRIDWRQDPPPDLGA